MNTLEDRRKKLKERLSKVSQRVEHLESNPDSELQKLSRKMRLISGGDVENYSIERDGRISSLKANQGDIEKAYYEALGEKNSLKSDVVRLKSELRDVNFAIEKASKEA